MGFISETDTAEEARHGLESDTKGKKKNLKQLRQWAESITGYFIEPEGRRSYLDIGDQLEHIWLMRSGIYPNGAFKWQLLFEKDGDGGGIYVDLGFDRNALHATVNGEALENITALGVVRRYDSNLALALFQGVFSDSNQVICVSRAGVETMATEGFVDVGRMFERG